MLLNLLKMFYNMSERTLMKEVNLIIAPYYLYTSILKKEMKVYLILMLKFYKRTTC